MAVRTGVIYLQKDKFQLYSPYLKSLVEYRFPPDIVRDLDVLNDDKLEEQIKILVTNNKIPPSNFIIVLADNAYFVKDFIIPPQSAQQPVKSGQPVPTATPKTTIADLKPQIDMFIEHVPYENVVSKTFPLKNGIRVCAVNQDLYATIERAFEKLGFTIASVFPGMVLGGELSAKPMDMNLINTTIQKTPSLKQYDIKTQAAFTPAKKEEEESVDEVQEELAQGKEPPKTNKKRLIGMIGILVILLVVLVIVYMQSMQPPAPQATVQPTVMPQTAPVATVPPTVPPVEPVQFENLTVQIVSSSASSSAPLRTALETYKFKDITTQTRSSTRNSESVIFFAGTVTQSTRTAILEEVEKIRPNITVEERQEGDNDITIILGK